jgi:hypothetical protein
VSLAIILDIVRFYSLEELLHHAVGQIPTQRLVGLVGLKIEMHAEKAVFAW